MPNSDQILLSWSDQNTIGNNNYRVERNTGNGYESTILRPKSDTSIQDDIRPHWLGQTIHYMIYERLGEQKLFSYEASVTIPSQLDPPRNLAYSTSYEEGIGDVITISWEHAQIFRNYIVEQYADGSWARVDKIAENTISIYAPPGEHRFRVMSHINGITSDPVEIAIPLQGG